MNDNINKTLELRQRRSRQKCEVFDRRSSVSLLHSFRYSLIIGTKDNVVHILFGYKDEQIFRLRKPRSLSLSHSYAI